MRRWMIWAGGILLVVGTSIALLLLQPHRPPYNYIPPTAELHRIMQGPMAQQYDHAPLNYSFKADYAQVKALAMAELARHDYVEFAPFGRPPDDWFCVFVPKKSLGIGGTSPDPPHKNMIRILRDMRLTDTSKPTGANKANGWVTVEIHGEPESSWLDRLRATLGL